MTWGALTLTLTLLAGLYTWFAFRRRGVVAGLRGMGITLIPVVLLLTDTLKTLGRIGDAIGDWALQLAFSPATWLGFILAGVSVTCFVAAGFLAQRGVGGRRAKDNVGAPPKNRGLSKSGRGDAAPVDAEFAEIEALLRQRGIT